MGKSQGHYPIWNDHFLEWVCSVFSALCKGIDASTLAMWGVPFTCIRESPQVSHSLLPLIWLPHSVMMAFPCQRGTSLIYFLSFFDFKDYPVDLSSLLSGVTHGEQPNFLIPSKKRECYVERAVYTLFPFQWPHTSQQPFLLDSPATHAIKAKYQFAFWGCYVEQKGQTIIHTTHGHQGDFGSSFPRVKRVTRQTGPWICFFFWNTLSTLLPKKPRAGHPMEWWRRV